MTARRTVSAMALLALVSACGNASQLRRSVGIDVPPPDEFMVISRAPLSMPSDLGALPPPQPGAPSLVEPDPQGDARAALAGAGAATVTTPASPAEQALVARAGPSDPMIRATLREEADTGAGERRFGLDSFLGFKIQQNPGAEAETLNAREESERLRSTGVAAPVAAPAN